MEDRNAKVRELLDKYHGDMDRLDKAYVQNSCDLNNSAEAVERWYEERKGRLVQNFTSELDKLDNNGCDNRLQEVQMMFNLIDSLTGKPITAEKANNIAISHGLVADRNVFAITEDGRLVILDKEGKYSQHIDTTIKICVTGEIKVGE